MFSFFQNKNNLPKWIILIIDISVCFAALFIAFQLRFNFNLPEHEITRLKVSFLLVIPVRFLLFVLYRTHADIVRYTSTVDAFRVLTSLVIGTVIFGVANFVFYVILEKPFIIPLSVLIIDFFISTVLLIGYRMFVKLAWMEFHNPRKGKTDVVIFGAGESGLITKRALDRDAGIKYKVIAFIDDDDRKIGMKLEGVQIYHPSKLPDILAQHTVAHLIISIQDIPSDRKKEIADVALHFNTKVLVVPPVINWINGELSFKQIKRIKIEELLERDVIEIDNQKIGLFIENQTVLVTGAAGSIGSEIVRQVLKLQPKLVVCIDRSENDLFQLENTISKMISKVAILIADINDERKMEHIFKMYQPDVVYHAAAYKHVPLMETHVHEAIKNNVFGTKLIADLALKYSCKRFVMISTDKAVNPTSVMGASKRMAEIYIQTLNKLGETMFITTRFGNVLGSNGSVIPLFRKQIENGGPITVTHPDVTRFFMTIREACQLVLEASAMGKGGEIFMFDMGHSVKIVDLAKKMIQLSGLTLGKDIQIVYTGLRPGEKLFEELLNNKENTMPTYHQRILIANVNSYDDTVVNNTIQSLDSHLENSDEETMVAVLKKTIPEYKSQNSRFQKLDV
jgi:FlaA1/EpsC-like NDP-sugar epimerase